MLDTIKVRLKAYLKAAGITLSNARIDAIAAKLSKKFPDLKEETDIDEKLKDLDEVQSFKEIQQFDDYQRGKAAKEKKDKEDAEKKAKEQSGTGDDDDDDDNDDDEGEKPAAKKTKDRTPKWAKGLIESNKLLADKLAAIEKEKSEKTIKEKISAHEKLKDIPADFYDEWRLPEKDEEIDAFADKVETKYSVFKQVENNDKASKATKPISGKKPDDKKVADEKEVAKIMDVLMPGTKVKTA